MKRYLICSLAALIAIIALNDALPVTRNEKKTDEKKSPNSDEPLEVATALEYERYLREVVEALESDQDFRKKLDKTPEADIRNGKIAQELDYVNHNVRTKLDEIKRRELERLREYANKQFELTNEIDRHHLKVQQAHLDHDNEHTFEVEDLRRLINRTSEDLAEADKKRRAEFKEYEMQKEFEREAQKKEMTPEQLKKFEQELKEQAEKHKKHEKVHHPGNKEQLEDVWENQDQMDKDEFNPKVFFNLHDVDSNGVWDETEVKALFVRELNKVYQSGLPEDDMRERAEEMERMREHVFEESDTNHDGLISEQEFLDYTSRTEFQKDPEWETLDQQREYTHEEYLEFERKRQAEVQQMIAQGLLPPHPNMPQGYQHVDPQQQMHYQQPNQQHMQQQQQYQQQQQQQYMQQPQQPVHLDNNQVYQHVPQQPQQQPNYPQAQPVYSQNQPQQQPNYQPQQQPNYQPQQQANYQPQQQVRQPAPVQQQPPQQPPIQQQQQMPVQNNIQAPQPKINAQKPIQTK